MFYDFGAQNDNCKHICTGLPFLFYWVNDKIEIIKHELGKYKYMKSDKDCLMVFGGGLAISADKNEES